MKSNPRRRDVLNYGAVALANIGAFSSLGYAALHALGDADPDDAMPTLRQKASVTGRYGPVIGWPIIAIHAVLLPNGAVMSFGTDLSGNQGGFIHDVWDPELGTG